MRLAVLRNVAATAEAFYHPYRNRKGRLIDKPIGLLKVVQSRVQHNILAALPMPESIHGGVRGKSPLTNASMHIGSNTVLRMDVRDFYPHITNRHVFTVLRRLGCSEGVSHVLTKLTTRNGHLPVGAPTSTTLANLVLDTVDEVIRERCAQRGLTFTRYVDDIAIGGDRPELLIALVVKVLREHDFKIAHRKTVIMRVHHRQVVTGLVINGGMRPRVPADRLQNVRAEIYYASFLDGPERLRAEDRIRSTLAWLQTVSPRQAKRLDKYRAKKLG